MVHMIYLKKWMTQIFLFSHKWKLWKKQFQSKDVEYCIKFICCLTNLSNAGRQKVMAKHKSQKQKRAEWYKSLNPEEKEKLFSGRAEYNKTLDPADKDKIISHVQVNKEVHRNSVQHDLDHKITAFQSKIRECSYYICSVCNNTIQKNCYPVKKNKCTTLSKNYLLSCIPMIPFCLGMTYHLSFLK